jgi:putative RNA 2'-phosphotransferase
MTRQQVHLTDGVSEAEGVGKRHSSDPTILCVDAKQMLEDGLTITKRGKSVYTTESVPPEYISEQTD